MAKIFEREVCGRCGGCGRYSYNQIDGDRCYGCNGTGERLTKRGAAARAWYEAHFKITVADVKPGMRIKAMGTTFTVGVIEPSTMTGYSVVDGVKIPFKPQTHLSTADRKYGMTAGADFEVLEIPTAERNAEVIAAALEYQATLTKAGTVRK